MLFCIILTISTIFYRFWNCSEIVAFFVVFILLYHSVKNFLLKSSSPAIIRSPTSSEGNIKQNFTNPTTPPSPTSPTKTCQSFNYDHQNVLLYPKSRLCSEEF